MFEVRRNDHFVKHATLTLGSLRTGFKARGAIQCLLQLQPTGGSKAYLSEDDVPSSLQP